MRIEPERVSRAFNDSRDAQDRTRASSYLLEHVVQRFERGKHGLDVVVPVEQPRRFFESFVPQFVPEDRDPDELLTDEDSLLDERGTVVPHLVHDRQRGTASVLARVLGCDREGINERLRMRAADIRQNVLDQLANIRIGGVDASDELDASKIVSGQSA